MEVDPDATVYKVGAGPGNLAVLVAEPGDQAPHLNSSPDILPGVARHVHATPVTSTRHKPAGVSVSVRAETKKRLASARARTGRDMTYNAFLNHLLDRYAADLE